METKLTSQILMQNKYGTSDEQSFRKEFYLTELEVYTLVLAKTENGWRTNVISGKHPYSATLEHPVLVHEEISTLEELINIENIIESKISQLSRGAV